MYMKEVTVFKGAIKEVMTLSMTSRQPQKLKVDLKLKQIRLFF